MSKEGRLQIFVEMKLEQDQLIKENLAACLKRGLGAEVANAHCHLVEVATDELIRRLTKRWDGKKIV